MFMTAIANQNKQRNSGNMVYLFETLNQQPNISQQEIEKEHRRPVEGRAGEHPRSRLTMTVQSEKN